MKSVVDLAEQVKDYAAAGKTIAPVENGTTAEGSYAVGEQFIREGVLYKAKTSITAGDALTLNTNYELADNLDTQIGNVKQALSNEVVTRAALGAHNLLPIDLKVIKELNVASSTWSDNKCTMYSANGSIEFTVNSNKSIGVKTTGTLDFTGYFFLTSGINYGSSRLSSYDGISNSTHKISGGSDAASATVQVCYDQLTEKTYIRVATGATGIDVTAYPMITLITDSDPTYQPYAMTNKELTDACFLSGTIGNPAVQNFTELAEYTIPADSWYVLHVQANVANATVGSALVIYLGSDYEANFVAIHRNSGIQYENCSVVIPLKAGTKVVYKCTDTAIQCQYRATPLA